ncbi:MAG: type II toxin-antitoxin system Phd/YefM family antitoxin [Bacteroidaceae bacterium]|nr:type II toxin-antitoxin system Phd/YefM family antitoxin [Bacteroidaceae bacterium]
MRTLTVTDFRNQMAAVLDSADAGEKVMIRRRNRLYTLTPVDQTRKNEITPALRRKINAARKEFREGKTVCCKTVDELHAFLDSL